MDLFISFNNRTRNAHVIKNAENKKNVISGKQSQNKKTSIFPNSKEVIYKRKSVERKNRQLLVMNDQMDSGHFFSKRMREEMRI